MFGVHAGVADLCWRCVERASSPWIHRVQAMMRPIVANPWFVKKRVGWGLRPGPWQGWAALGVFIVLFGLFSVSAERHVVNGVISMLITAAVFGVVMFLTSEGPGRSSPGT